MHSKNGQNTTNLTKQAIQKKPLHWKSKPAISKCEGECIEEEVPLNQTSHTTDIETDRQYGFRLVLYNGDVVVQSSEDPFTKGIFLYILDGYG